MALLQIPYTLFYLFSPRDDIRGKGQTGKDALFSVLEVKKLCGCHLPLFLGAEGGSLLLLALFLPLHAHCLADHSLKQLYKLVLPPLSLSFPLAFRLLFDPIPLTWLLSPTPRPTLLIVQ